jgi:hypothetical protein
MFIVKIGEDFIEKARAFAAELMSYKRAEWCSRKLYLGDLDPEYCKQEIRARYNINDSGDIYFINSKFANYCMWTSWEYKECSRREAAGFKKKDVLRDIREHHNYDKIHGIVEKYFKIA